MFWVELFECLVAAGTGCHDPTGWKILKTLQIIMNKFLKLIRSSEISKISTTVLLLPHSGIIDSCLIKNLHCIGDDMDILIACDTPEKQEGIRGLFLISGGINIRSLLNRLTERIPIF